jgi:hypothetical protein
MSRWHNVCLLSVNLWSFVNEEVPVPGVRQEGNAGKDLVRTHYNMRPIFGIRQILGQLIGDVLPDGVSVKHFDLRRYGQSAEFLNVGLFNEELGRLQQQNVSALLDELTCPLDELKSLARSARC